MFKVGKWRDMQAIQLELERWKMHEDGTGRPECSRPLGNLGVIETIISIITTLARVGTT
jgi:hypothetical protein